MEFLRKLTLLGKLMVLLSLTLGFRTYFHKNKWSVSNADALSRKLFVVYSGGTDQVPNDLTPDDPLAGAGSTVTVDQLMQSIFDDYNNIGASYITLVDTTDPDYNATNAAAHTISINFGGATGGNSGEASLEISGGKIVGCTIDAESNLKDSAQDFISTMTHEIGHCLGLDHPQDTVHAVMSYYTEARANRLQTDDKMGVIFLFPTEPAYAEETSTLGLSCSER